MIPVANPTDDDLLRRMKAGDEEGFTALYRRTQGAVYRFALRMSGNTALSEEVTQEAFLVLLRNPNLFDAARGSLSAFLIGVARNHLLKRWERDRIYLPFEEEPAHENGNRPARPVLVATGDPATFAAQTETAERVRQAVLALPPNYREAVALCDLEELSYEEAAAALGCAVGTIRSRLHRGRALLLAKLEMLREPARANARKTASG
jgi:RNA polymerase sigma-70 factor (ECF subfamily)